MTSKACEDWICFYPLENKELRMVSVFIFWRDAVEEDAGTVDLPGFSRACKVWWVDSAGGSLQDVAEELFSLVAECCEVRSCRQCGLSPPRKMPPNWTCWRQKKSLSGTSVLQANSWKRSNTKSWGHRPPCRVIPASGVGLWAAGNTSDLLCVMKPVLFTEPKALQTTQVSKWCIQE